MSIEIILDNYYNTCYPGQTLAGRVECYFNKEKQIRGIRIQFKGRAKTRWTESESYYDSTEKKHKTKHVTYTGHEVYFNAEYNLVSGGDNFIIPAGKHTYPFSYIIPQNVPSSFEGIHGNIRYSIKGTVDRPWKFDYERILSLHVTSPLDLNYLPGVKDPVAISVDKHVGCCCCRSGPLTFNFSLPVTGYVPQQDVNIGAYVQNMTNVSAESVKFKIIKNYQFIAHMPSIKRKYSSDILTKCIDGGIGAHGDKSWTATLTIPAMDFPNLLACSIIRITYDLEAKVVLPCPHTNLSSTIPFFIGNIPISGIATGLPGPPSMPNYNPIPPSQHNSYLPTQMNAYPLAPGASAPPSESLSNPSAPSDEIKYPPDGPPYPMSSPAPHSSQNSSAPYPSATKIEAPYPPAPTGLPYLPTSSGALYPPAPPFGGAPTCDWSQGEPFKDTISTNSPPTYEEAQKFLEKK